VEAGQYLKWNNRNEDGTAKTETERIWKNRESRALSETE
jgi:hypothetical protein